MRTGGVEERERSDTDKRRTEMVRSVTDKKTKRIVSHAFYIRVDVVVA